jgi:GNAT superfamily N-acetyltransferase
VTSLLVRAVRPDAEDEIALVAARMRLTLIEVLGEERGTALYTMDWLRARARLHLDPSKCRGQIFVAEIAERVVGHTIVRVDRDDDGRPIGLFSTTFVEPEARRLGVAESLVRHGEAWMNAEGMTVAVTDTSAANTKLIRLFEKHGYAIALRDGEMVRLEKRL